jgi:NADH:ubiquinone oxidoreductase subunit C
MGFIGESESYIWVANIYNYEYNGIGDDKIKIKISFEDKSYVPSVKQVWNNRDFFSGVYFDDKEAIREASKYMDEQGISDFKLFLKVLDDNELL